MDKLIRVKTSESIQRQKKDRGGKITSLIQEIYNNTKGMNAKSHLSYVNSKYSKKLTKALSDINGSNIQLIINTDAMWGMLPTLVNKRHVLIYGGNKKEVDKQSVKPVFNSTNDPEDYKLFTEKGGTIDTKTGKLGGSYAKAPVYLYLDLYTAKSVNITARELTAINLHELGHMFSFFEKMHLTGGTLTTMAELSESIRNDDDFDYTKYSHYLEKANIDDKNLKTNNRSVYSWNLSKELYHKSYDLFEVDRIAYLDTEYNADNFATKLGYGPDLAYALSKLTENVVIPYPYTKIMVYGYITQTLLALLTFSLSISLIPIAIIIYTVEYIVTNIFVTIVVGLIRAAVGSYDNPNVRKETTMKRLKAIRRTIVSGLKEKGDKRESVLLDQIDTVTEIINNYDTNDRTIPRVVYDFLTVPDFKFNKISQYNEMVASLADNDLFIHAHNWKFK